MGDRADHDYDYLFKLVLAGKSHVGKSTLFSQFTGNKIQSTTHEIATRMIHIDDNFVKAEVWDITIMESEYYEGALGALVVYDVTRRDSFGDVAWWLKELRRHADANIVIMLVGNKADLHDSRAVSTQEAQALAEKENLLFMETSAETKLNVETAFTEVLTQICRGLGGTKVQLESRKRQTVNFQKTEHLLVAEKEKRKELKAEVEKKASEMKEYQRESSEKLQKIMDELQAEKEKSRKLSSQHQLAFQKLEEAKKNLEEELAKKSNENKKLEMIQKNTQNEFVKFRSWVEDHASMNYSVVKCSEFTAEEIEKATDNFNENHKIGEGGYGPVYKTVLHKKDVAIKILKKENRSKDGERQFKQEVEILRRVRHPNLVTLIGRCVESMALVYEFVPNGSLQSHLSNSNLREALSWKRRINIAVEVCSALIFLHTTKPHGIVHADLKPDNILLDSNFRCKLSDFGISRQLDVTTTSTGPHYKTNSSSASGTFCYQDPEYVLTLKITPKSDVYALGIVLLQLVTGKKDPTNLRSWVEKKKNKEIFDNKTPAKKRDKVMDACAKWPLLVAEKMAELGLWCSQPKSKKRPDLTKEVLVELKNMGDTYLKE